MFSVAASASDTVNTHLTDGIIALAAVVLAYLLARNGTKADSRDAVNQKALEKREESVTKALEKLGDRFDSMNNQLIGLLTLMTPTLAELEQIQASIASHGKEIAIMIEWRKSHEEWSKETISRLERGQHTTRRTDTT